MTSTPALTPPVRTRFAPSPTGYLHIGGVRTALFNWLFARHHGGQFILRIDDTDQQRHVEEALRPILDGFRWLGLDWDEGPDVGGPHGPYFQSDKLPRYQAAVNALLTCGAAYKDYARPEELEFERQEAQQRKESFRYSRRWMATSPEDESRFAAEGRAAVVRLKMPREGNLVITDQIRGEVQFAWAGEPDTVIQRADGTCLYHLASVVDDYDMQISHVIRAEEHLSNTPRQIFIAQRLGYPLPCYAHVPYVAEPGSKNKLSKRKLSQYLKQKDFADLMRRGERIAERMHWATSPETFNPVVVDFYRQIGYGTDALINYLLLLGWSWDDRTEYFSRQEMITRFSLDRVNNSPASFDPQKLSAFQDHYSQLLTVEQKFDLVLPYLQGAAVVASPPTPSELQLTRQIVQAAGDRISIAGDILDYQDFFVADDQLLYEADDVEKRLVKATDAQELLRRFRTQLERADDFSAESLELLLKKFVQEEGIKIGQIIHALRVAVTGKSVGFGMFEILQILGKERSLARMDRILGQLALRQTC